MLHSFEIAQLLQGRPRNYVPRLACIVNSLFLTVHDMQDQHVVCLFPVVHACTFECVHLELCVAVLVFQHNQRNCVCSRPHVQFSCRYIVGGADTSSPADGKWSCFERGCTTHLHLSWCLTFHFQTQQPLYSQPRTVRQKLVLVKHILASWYINVRYIQNMSQRGHMLPSFLCVSSNHQVYSVSLPAICPSQQY